MKNKFKNMLLSVSLIYSPTVSLPRLHADSLQVTVSGLSSGAMMAEQLLVAESDRFLGAGIIAGAPYGCAEGLLDRALNHCMKHPENISVDSLISEILVLEKNHEIAPIEYLKNRRLFILNGKNDTLQFPIAGEKLFEWSRHFIAENNIATEFHLNAGHGFPTLNFGSDCKEQKSPWINNCGYDTAQNILQHLYQRSLNAGHAKMENLIHFNQIPFLALGSTMAYDGFAYVPTKCQLKNSRCALHITLHGCSQTTNDVQEAFISYAGYNSWAEANQIIILYPMVAPSFFNPKACWDWWGYTHHNYLTRKAPQIQSIMNMVDHLTEK